MLRCCGRRGHRDAGLRRAALSRALAAERDVVVDLRELTFADTSLMLDLAMVARRLRTAGRPLLHLRRRSRRSGALIEIVGLHRLPGVVVDGPVARARR